MKNFILIFFLLLLACFSFGAETLPVDEDIKKGRVSEKDFILTESENELNETPEELDIKDADENESSPSMPEEADKSIYFGDVRIIIQYTSLSMKDFNNLAGSKIKHISNGLDLGLALGIKINSYFSPFFRFDIITSLTEPGNFDFVMYTNAVPIDAGLEYSFYIPESPLRITLSSCGGLTIAYGKYDSIDHEKIPYEEIRTFGTGFNIITDISIQYHLSSALSAGFTAGYRFMPVSKMTIIDGNNIEGTKTGQVLKAEGKDIIFDYSGLTAGLSIEMNY